MWVLFFSDDICVGRKWIGRQRLALHNVYVWQGWTYTRIVASSSQAAVCICMYLCGVYLEDFSIDSSSASGVVQSRAVYSRSEPSWSEQHTAHPGYVCPAVRHLCLPRDRRRTGAASNMVTPPTSAGRETRRTWQPYRSLKGIVRQTATWEGVSRCGSRRSAAQFGRL